MHQQRSATLTVGADMELLASWSADSTDTLVFRQR
jgi:hypothetical protein